MAVYVQKYTKQQSSSWAREEGVVPMRASDEEMSKPRAKQYGVGR